MSTVTRARGMSKKSDTRPSDRAIVAVVRGNPTHVLEGECVGVSHTPRGTP